MTPAPSFPIRALLTAALADAWALVAPVDCAGCGAPDRALCPVCTTALRPSPRRALIDVDGTTLPIVAGLAYEGAARAALLALKAEGRTELARPLAHALRPAVEQVWPAAGAELLVAVPGSRPGTAQRGFTPAALLARRAGLVPTRALAALDAGPQQKQRGLDARLAGQHPRFAARGRLAERRVVLIDDIVTSGATLRDAARALRAAGAHVVGAAAVAATPRRRGASSILWRFCGVDDEGPGDKVGAEGYGQGKEA